MKAYILRIGSLSIIDVIPIELLAQRGKLDALKIHGAGKEGRNLHEFVVFTYS